MLPLTLLGPLVIAATHEGQGIGSALMRAALDAADAGETPPMLLIGDEPYYGRFGFSAARTGAFRSCPARSTAPGCCCAAARICRRWAGWGRETGFDARRKPTDAA